MNVVHDKGIGNYVGVSMRNFSFLMIQGWKRGFWAAAYLFCQCKQVERGRVENNFIDFNGRCNFRVCRRKQPHCKKFFGRAKG
jgi:hypothetical protein